ncbi:hypothetical protein K5X82_13050 [Halosquirtibacter xylanolyticus]|uniref:hypothetical protein n=1 Tax=Halosquirtibacter xylanolyticus TaxID=3374599 RepID=UPI00374862C7|nr:hypothetical protein K5X82_13050 [Prolixibacteraceae bacterium]
MRRVLLFIMLGTMFFSLKAQEDKKSYVTFETGVTLSADEIIDKDNVSMFNWKGSMLPGFYFRTYLNQKLSKHLILREGIGVNYARQHSEIMDYLPRVEEGVYFYMSDDARWSFNIPIHLIWEPCSRVNLYTGVALDLNLTSYSFPSTTTKQRLEDYKKASNYRKATFTLEAGTNIKLISRTYINLGYRYTPRPLEIPTISGVNEGNSHHQFNIGLSYKL